MNDLWNRIGYKILVWGPGDQLMFLCREQYYTPLWYIVYDRHSLMSDLHSMMVYSLPQVNGMNVIQMMTPWGESIII